MPFTAESLQAAFKYLFIEEVHALKELAQSLPNNPVVVNIGAGSGTSGLAFMESRPGLFLITIDLQADDSPFGCLAAEDKVLREAGFNSSRWIHLQGDSKDWGENWQKKCYKMFTNVRNGIATYKVNMVFVDGDHTYEGARGDILAWLPHIKTGGIIAVHDFEKERVYAGTAPDDAPHPLPWPGVDKAVNELLVPNFEIVAHVKTLIAFRVTDEGREKP